MKLLLNADLYDWRMTGLLGNGGRWFIGFSKRLPPTKFARPGDRREASGIDRWVKEVIKWEKREKDNG